MFVAIDDSGVIQGAGIDRLFCGAPFLSEAYIRATPRAKFKVKPTFGIINGAIVRKVPGAQFEVRLLPFWVHHKGGAGTPLAPIAVIDDDNIWVTNGFISDVTADATAYESRLTDETWLLLVTSNNLSYHRQFFWAKASSVAM